MELTEHLGLKVLDEMKKKWTQSTWVRNLGASVIGHECRRYLWFNWRYAMLPDFPPRILRLFDRGHREEPVFIQELEHAGVKVYDCQKNIVGYKGHFVAHPDGFADNVPDAPKTTHVLEFKTMNDKSFVEMVGKGVESAQPKHFAQMQIIMHMTGVKRALYLAVNKNTDDVYGERIRYDKTVGERLVSVIEHVVDAPTPPERNKSWTCKFCNFKELCLEKNPEIKPHLNCRTCVNSSPVEGGRWECKIYGDIPKDYQLKGCDKHLLIPGILNAEVVNTDGETFVEYDNGVLNFNEDYVTSLEDDQDLEDLKEVEHTITHGVPF